MICPSCSIDSPHIKVVHGKTGCHNCMGFSMTQGRTDKVLTYAADRVTEQHVQFEGDQITPFIVDRSTNRAVVNEEFIDKYPTQATTIFSREELDKAGYEDLKPTENDDTGEGIEFVGDESESIGQIIEQK